MVNYLMQKKMNFSPDTILVIYFLVIMIYDFDDSFVSPLDVDEKVPPMPTLERDEEVKKEMIKI